MISSYTKDKIDILRNNIDQNGTITGTSNQLNVKARVEDYNKVVRNLEGQEVMGNMIIFLDPAIDIKYNDRIKVKERNGEAVQNPDKIYSVFTLQKLHGFRIMGWEIVIGSGSAN
jgi:hypothetical protein